MKRYLYAAAAAHCLLLLAPAAQAWDAFKKNDEGGKAEWRGNTHLFIVQRAFELLAKSPDAAAKRAASFLKGCGSDWRAGLFDADDKSELVDSSNKGSHFYNPTPSDGCHTFWSVDCKDSYFNARINAKHQLAHALTGKSALKKEQYGFHKRNKCYALGLALHFMTDVTMPFHAASYSGGSLPLMLHPTFESYVPRVQHKFVARSWSARSGSESPDQALVRAAKDAKAMFQKLRDAISKSSDYCKPGEEPGGLLCYPKCKKGYHGVGPVCWEDCPKKFTDTGGHCLKPKAYGRGVGYPWKFGDTAFDLTEAKQRCKKKNAQGCEKWGAIYYPKCRPGFHAFACCVCTPNCPKGMTDIGVSCQKRAYGRGVGVPRALCTYTSEAGVTYTGACYRGKEGVHEAIGKVLLKAQRNTADYLHAFFRANPSFK